LAVVRRRTDDLRFDEADDPSILATLGFRMTISYHPGIAATGFKEFIKAMIWSRTES